jgi:hypothetical protein
MKDIDLRRIGADMSAARMCVPPANRKKFDIESKDFFDAIRAAADDAPRAGRLLSQWNSRVEWLTREPQCHVAPPCLVRRDEEPVEQYISRCYAAEGVF